jgi:hypothetical protein
MPFSKGTSENTILFFEGGHDHDGQSSALIDVSQYSIYDFVVGKVGSSTRQTTQQRNFDNLKTVICNIVTTDILGPAGVRLAPNSVQSVNIAAGAVTASELAANIVLVNNIISSGNYVPNTSGWAINSNGFAEFDIAVIRGQIQADSIYINAFNYWNSNGTFSVGAANNFMFYNGTNLELTGTVTATAGQIAGWTISGDNLVTGGNFAGSMELGAFAETSGGAGVFIEGAADGNNDYGVSKLIGGELILSTTIGNDATATYGPKGVVYNRGAQRFEFFYDAANDLLWAYIDDQPYCIQQCGGSPPEPVAVSPGGVDPGGVDPGGVDPVSPVDTGGVSPGGVDPVGTVVVVVGVSPDPCAGNNGDVIPSNCCSPPCPQDFICIKSSGGNFCIGF